MLLVIVCRAALRGIGARSIGLAAGARHDPEPLAPATASWRNAEKLEHFASIGVTEVVMRLPSAGRDEVMPELDRQAELVASLRA